MAAGNKLLKIGQGRWHGFRICHLFDIWGFTSHFTVKVIIIKLHSDGAITDLIKSATQCTSNKYSLRGTFLERKVSHLRDLESIKNYFQSFLLKKSFLCPISCQVKIFFPLLRKT